LKLSFNPQEHYNTNGEKFSVNHSCLPEYDLLYYSITSNFKEIDYPHRSSSHAKVSAASEAGKSIPTSTEKILIVDDEVDIARFFKLALEQQDLL
jgi:hypothetical protein